MAKLKGKVAVITGGTSGIGEASVELFVAEGATVIFTGRNVDAGAAITARLGPAARFMAADAATEAGMQAAVAAAVAATGRLDILFNNAGGPAPGGVDSLTEAQFHHAMNLLLGSTLFGIRHAAPIMKQGGGGAIINNSSVAAGRAHLGEYLYSIAKAAVSHATRLAGVELGPFGIRVNAISPGAIATPIFFGGSSVAAGLEAGHREARMAKLRGNLDKATPLHRSGLPRHIAEAALFLASDAALHINCHDLVVDGGMTAGARTQYQ